MKLYFFLKERKAMATGKTNTSLEAALLGDVEKEGVAEMRSDIKALFESTSGNELADAAIERVQRNAAQAVTWSVE